MPNYAYYVYSTSIARVDKKTHQMEIKDYKTNEWKAVTSPEMWKRIEEEGNQVSEKEAQEIDKLLRNSSSKNKAE